MTETEWLACSDIKQMIQHLRGQCSDRRYRLFSIACCRRITQYITDERSRAAIQFAELYADVGLSRRKGRPSVVRAAQDACRAADRNTRNTSNSVEYATRMIPVNAANAAAATLQSEGWWAADFASGFSAQTVAWVWLIANRPTMLPGFDPSATFPEREQQASLLRCIVGNPFRTAPLDPAWSAWQDGTVVKLAQSIYGDRAFDLLPILADALEDAGCIYPDILAHCREPSQHSRGCWVIDLLLGKK